MILKRHYQFIATFISFCFISGLTKGATFKTETSEDFVNGEMKNISFLNGPSGKISLETSLGELESLPLNYSSLPVPLSKFGSAQFNNRLYVAGGVSSGDVSRKEVFSIGLNGLGPTGAWRVELNLPNGLTNASLLVVNGNLVVVPSFEARDILSSTINKNDGTLGPWKTIGQLPFGVQHNSSVLIGRRLFLVTSDGTGQSFSTAFSPNGNLVSWRSEEQVPFNSVGFELVSNIERVFLIGGLKNGGSVTNNVISIASNNSQIGSWESEPPLPEALAFHGASIYRDLLIVAGGSTGLSSSKNIYSASISNTGRIVGWEKQIPGLLTPIQSHKSIFTGDCFLNIGGESSLVRQQHISSFSFKHNSVNVTETIIGSNDIWGDATYSRNVIAVSNRMYFHKYKYGSQAIYSAEIGPDGNLNGPFRTETLPSIPGNWGGSLAFMGGRFYFFILESVSNLPTKIYSTTLNNDGSFKEWKLSGTYPPNLYQASTLFLGNRLYLFGGRFSPNITKVINNVYSAQIDETGTISPWRIETSLPIAISASSVYWLNNRIIVAGGMTGSYPALSRNVYSTEIDSNGFLGGWTKQSEFPFLLAGISMCSVGNRLYAASGLTVDGSGGFFSRNRVIYSQVSDLGIFGPWATVVDGRDEDRGGVTMVSNHGFSYYLIGTSLVKISKPILCNFGVYFSKVFDLFSVRNIENIAWNRLVNPSNTSLNVSLASATDQASPLDSFTEVVNGLSINKLARFVQLKFRFESNDATATPGLDDFTITHYNDSTHPDGAPVLNVVNVTTSSLTVSLQDRSVGEEAFQFFLSRTSPPAGDPIQYSSVVGSSGTTTNYTFEGLLHGTTYYLRARGWNAADSIDGAYSNLIGIQTPSLDLKRRLSTELLGFDSVVIGWPRVDNAIEYRVFDEGNNLLATKSSSTLSFTETVLSPNTQLFRRIEASDSVGVIQVGSVVLYTGLAAPLSTDFVIESQGDNWINIQVNPPVNAVAGLSGTKIILRSEGTIVRTARLKNKESSYRFDSLPVGKNYQITTSYLNGDGIESMESPVLETFVGLASEAFSPAKDKFRISDGIDFPIESNVPVQGSLKIYDSQQRKLREIPIDSPAGHSVVRWDGRDDSGNPVYSGIYWAVSETDHFGRKTFKVAGIR